MRMGLQVDGLHFWINEWWTQETLSDGFCDVGAPTHCVSAFQTLLQFLQRRFLLTEGECRGVQAWVGCVFWLATISYTDLESSVFTPMSPFHRHSTGHLHVQGSSWQTGSLCHSSLLRLSSAVISPALLHQARCIIHFQILKHSLKFLVC